jgi:hypothetical protein
MPTLKITISTEADTVLDQFLLEANDPATRGGGDTALAAAVKDTLDGVWNVVEIEDDEAEEA